MKNPASAGFFYALRMAFVARQKQLRAVCCQPTADYHQRQEKIFDPVLKLRATATDTVIQSYYSNDDIAARIPANFPVPDCPFDCQPGIANTHGNLTLPARNKE